MYDELRDEAGHTEASARGGEAAYATRPCPACGATGRREEARFCATCGRALGREADYFPADSLRSSYHLQNRRDAATLTSRLRQQQQQSADDAATRRREAGRERVDLFMRNRNGASTTALAFVTYSLVPYLGILFCPGALLMGGIGLVRAQRSPHLGGRRASVMSIALGVVIFGAQILLWWILYKVPEWSRQSPWGL